MPNWMPALCGCLAASLAHADAWIRVNLVGYLPDDPKIAILSSDDPITGKFTIGELNADIGADCGAWGPFRHNYRLDFSTVTAPGRYTIKTGAIESPPIHIGVDAYKAVNARLIDFMRLQRCGENPVTGEKCHQQDAIDTENGRRVDLVGGWHDAGDRLKHMITTTYCAAALQLAGERDEAAHGLELVRKLNPSPDRLYVQIGDDRDHMPPETLWHDDKSDYGHGPGGPRSAWPALGKPQGPKHQNRSDGLANLAGRIAAALALAGDIERAESLYKLAKSRPGCAMSIPVRAPYYYCETSYFDDLQWAATELYIATRRDEFLREAIEWADKAGSSEWLGKPLDDNPKLPIRHGHYEWFPYVNLAHWRLAPHVDEQTRQRLARYYRTSLDGLEQIAAHNPYRLGTPLVWCSTNDVIAAATTAVLYEQLTGDRRFQTLAAECRDWIFGRNPWGVSMVIGVPDRGDHASRPHHLFWKLKKHLPIGGLVDGPVYKDINDGLKFTGFPPDRLARFQSEVGVYHDLFEDFSTNEPIIDGTVSLRLLLELWNR